ncbi:MAG: hypothetical protein K2Z81_26555 [Cyanobacteria bacterium]|nr:hypothetical protein [Cyanobacteriota bacterium]
MSCLESTKRFLSDAGAFIGHYCLDAAAPLAFPTVAKRVLKSYNGASGRAPHAGLYHCTKKMGRYNPLFLAAVTLQVISRIALPRVAEHTLAHSAAKYGYMCGRAAVASLAVFSLIVFSRAVFSDIGKYAYVLNGANPENAPWF